MMMVGGKVRKLTKMHMTGIYDAAIRILPFMDIFDGLKLVEKRSIFDHIAVQ